METKVRKGYQQANRLSPNMVYAKFIHGETRPIDGVPDPHYHIHVFAMNATFDEVEKQWKALEVGNTVGDRIFFEAHFNHLLATKLEISGYGMSMTPLPMSSRKSAVIGTNGKRSWELGTAKRMLELQEFAVENDCRLIVTGDTKQHHSVQWGDALRILERSGESADSTAARGN